MVNVNNDTYFYDHVFSIWFPLVSVVMVEFLCHVGYFAIHLVYYFW